MSTVWSQIVENNLVSQVWTFYCEQNIPLQIRSIQPNKLYSQWFEDSYNQVVITTSNPSDPNIKKFTSQLTSQFFEKLNIIIRQRISDAQMRQNAHDEVAELDLQERINKLKLRFKGDAFGFFKMMYDCLKFERDLLAANANTALPTPNFDTNPPDSFSLPIVVSPVAEQISFNFNVNNEICDLRLKRDELANETNAVRAKENATCHPPDYFYCVTEQIELHGQKQELSIKAKRFADLGVQIFQQLNAQVYKISNLLELWAVDQRSVLNGAQSIVSLTSISVLTKIVAKGLLDLYQILKIYNGVGVLDPGLLQTLEELKLWTQDAAKKLIMETFIVEEQPKQILLLKSKVKQSKNDHTETGIKVRLLVGTTFKFLENPVVGVKLISRPDANKVYDDNTFLPQPAMELLDKDKERMMELDEKNDTFIANFVKIEMPKSRPKQPPNAKDPDPVPRRKYYFHFRACFSCPDLDIFKLNIFTTSVPIIANSHTKEKHDSWAAILWANASAEVGQSPFEVKTEIECDKLVNIFSSLFKRDTGRPLSKRNTEFLSDKLLSSAPKVSGTTVTWDMFFQNAMKIPCLRPEPNPQNDSPVDEESQSEAGSKSKTVKQVTFHCWLYETLKCCTPSPRNKTGISKYWKEGRIEGFISKGVLTNILQEKRGRFALYFSEALLGGLTVAWFGFDSPEPGLQRLSPLTPSTFVENKELERRLYDQKKLIYLYQDHFDGLKKNVFLFPEDDSEKLTSIQREMRQRDYILTINQTRNLIVDTTFMHPAQPSTSGGIRPNFISAS